MAIKFYMQLWIAFFILVVYGCSHPVTAAERTTSFECTGTRLIFTQHNKDPIVMEILRERGVWMMLPTGKREVIQTFYNLDSGKVAKIGKNYNDQYYVEFFHDVDYANAHRPERILPCRQN